MKRDEVLSLLKDLMVVCESMHYAPVVSLSPNSKRGRWKLSIKWVNENEKGCFDKLIKEHGLMATETEDSYTIFQRP